MKTYLIGRGGHYRLGRLYSAGEQITVEDEEMPADNWTLVVEPPPASAAGSLVEPAFVEPPTKPKRPSDKSI